MFPRVDGLRSIEFGMPGTSRETLVGLVLHGNKRATAGLLKDYEAENEPVEHVGELLAMPDNDGTHVGTLVSPGQRCSGSLTCRTSSPSQRQKETLTRRTSAPATSRTGRQRVRPSPTTPSW
jgi:hypothetical protein